MPLAPPPPITDFALLAKPSEADIRRAEGLNARLTTSTESATMICYVRADGRLDACSPDSAPRANYASALVALQDKYQLDVSQPVLPRRVKVSVGFPKSADRARRASAARASTAPPAHRWRLPPMQVS